MLLASTLATTTDRESTRKLFQSVVEDLIDGYRTRTDLAGTRSMTKVISHSKRRESCTVTVEWTHPGAAETFTVPVEMTCAQTGVPAKEGTAEKDEEKSEL